MAQNIQLKRSSLSGKVPDTGSLTLGELAINTYDGKIFFKKSGSVASIESILTTNSTTTGSIRLTGTGSFGSLKVNNTLTVNHGETIVSGSTLITSDLTVLGSVNARQFNISIISSSTLFESGSSNFGNSLDDTHTFTGSVNITGSFLLNGQEVGGGSTTGSFTGSFTGDGSGLRGVISDDLPIDGWDYDSNSSASISEFNSESNKYLIDFQWEQEVGTPIGFKTFISNVTGSSQIIPTEAGIKFIVGNQLVATVGPNGIESTTPAGTISGSSQLTSSYDSRYVMSGSITQTTWDNIANKPTGIVSGSSQVVGILTSLNTYTASQSTSSLVNSISSLNTYTASQSTASIETRLSTLSNVTSSLISATGSYASTGSNLFVGIQTYSGSILPANDNAYDLGSPDKQWRDIYISSASLYIDGQKVLGSTNQELQITTDNGQSVKILEAGSDTITLQSVDGNITFASSGNGDVVIDPTNGIIGLKGTTTLYSGYKIVSSDGNAIQFGNDIAITGSINTTGNINGVNISTLSSSVATQISTIQTNTGSTNTRLDVIESKYATTGSNTFVGTQIFSGSVYITSNLIVQGSSSLQNITASAVSIGTNIVKLNTSTPAVRFAGLQVIDSGSTAMSASLFWDSLNNHWIYQRESGAVYGGGMLISGPRNLGALGDEVGMTTNRLVMGIGGDHISSSQVYVDNTGISIPGNLEVTGSIISTQFTAIANITGSLIISASSNTISIANLNSYTSSNEQAWGRFFTYSSSLNQTTASLNTFSASALTQLSNLSNATSSYETKGRGIVSGSSQITYASISSIPAGIVSGSSQITLSSTTGYGSVINQAVLTTSSPTFAGGTITGPTLTIGSAAAATNVKLFLNSVASKAAGIEFQQGGVSQWLIGNGIASEDNNFELYNSNGNMAMKIIKSTNAITFIGNTTITGNLTISGTLTENSSLRYKENVETIKYGLDKVLQMRGVTYDKKDNGVREMGVIAEEIYEVLPEVVLKNEEGEVDSVSYGRIVGVLIEAIKDLKKEIEDLKSNR